MSLFQKNPLIAFMVMTSMISDFSSVLLHIRNRNILFTKPIDRKTINAAKIVHIFKLFVASDNCYFWDSDACRFA